MAAFQRILFPTDFSEASYLALDTAIRLAQEENGEVCIVHIEPDLNGIVASGTLPAHEVADQHAEAIQSLCALIAQGVPADMRAYTVLRQGDAAQGIVSIAHGQASDVIVMTTHGAGGHASAPLGSVAINVLRRAPCPVLMVNGRQEGISKNLATALLVQETFSGQSNLSSF